MLMDDRDHFFLLEYPTGNGVPHLFSDPSLTLEQIRSALHPLSDPLDDFELVEVDILVKR